MKIPHLVTSKTPLTFLQALAALRNGECLGIQPQQNTSYLILRSHGAPSLDRLIWQGTQDGTCRAEQFELEWFTVSIDHRELNKSLT